MNSVSTTPGQRLQKVMAGEIADKVPHFELVFQLPEEAFGLSWPSQEEVEGASPAERNSLLGRYLLIWEKIVERYGWAAIAHQTPLESHFEVISRAREHFGDEVLHFAFNGMGTYWMPNGEGMMFMTEMFYEHPEETHAEACRKRDASIELAKRQTDQGADFICINSDYAFNTGPFISPAMFAEYVTPYLAEIVHAIHEMGSKAILHSDGDLRLLLDQLVSTGLDGYQSIDPQGHMDIAEVKKTYGDRLVLMGNVKTALLQDVDEAAIRASVRYCMTHGKPGGKYIFSTSNCIFKGMPLESYHIMLDEYEKLAYYDAPPQ